MSYKIVGVGVATEAECDHPPSLRDSAHDGAEDSVRPGGASKLQHDIRLMRLVAAGDKEAMWKLHLMLWPRVLTLVRNMCHPEDDARDLAQDIMVQVFQSAHRFRGDGCVEAWAKSVGFRTLLSHFKKGTRRRRTFVVEPRHKELDDMSSSTGDEPDMLAGLVQRRIRALIVRLPPMQRAAVVLKLLLGHSMREVAQILGKRQDHVSYLLRKARVSLIKWAKRDPELYSRLGREHS